MSDEVVIINSQTPDVIIISGNSDSSSSLIRVFEGTPGPKGPIGLSGYSPNITISGDRIFIDGVIAGNPLTGPTGEQGQSGYSPEITISGDRILIDGIISSIHLTGPTGSQGIQGIQGESGYSPIITVQNDQILIDGVISSPPLSGSQGIQGPSGASGYSPIISISGDQVVINNIVSSPHLSGQKGDQGIQGPSGLSGYSPTIVLVDDQIIINGITGQHLTGPTGEQGIQGIQGVSGLSGYSPVLTWVSDQIAIDGIVSGPNLTGPVGPTGIEGHSPVLTWVTDQIAIDGIISGPTLTGPAGPQGPAGETGPIGPTGAPGTTNYNELTNIPTGFTPLIHGNESHTTPFGDMFKSVYDTTNNGLVDSAENVVKIVHFISDCLKGEPVCATTGISSGILYVDRADSSFLNKMPAIGISCENVTAGESKKIAIFGLGSGINTSSFNINDDLYVAQGGGLTNIPPPYIQYIATVVSSDPNSGAILIDAEPQKDIQNFAELSQLESTGLIEGCDLSINSSDPSKYDMTAGVGIIVDNYTNPSKPVKTIVQIPARTGISPQFLESDSTSYVFSDSNGNLIYTNDGSQADDRRELISIGWVDHTDNTVINSTKVQPFSVTMVNSQLNDFFLSFGPFNIEGNTFSSYTGLQVRRSAGTTFDSNANYSNNHQSPHILTRNSESPIDIYYYLRNGSGDWINDNEAVTNIDPNYYDANSGVLIPVPSGNWTIQVLAYYAQTNSNDFQYGQTLYPNKPAALSALQDAVEINPYNSYDTFRGWLIVKEGCSDITDTEQAEFRAAGKLGLFDVAAGGGVGGEINTASNIGISGLGFYEQKIGVDLQFLNVESGNQFLNISKNNSNKTLVFSPKIPSIGDASTNELVIGSDSRLTGTRNPNTHALSHKSGNSDEIKLDELGLPSDNTNLNASIYSHGLLPKLAGDSSKYLAADGTWQTVVVSGNNTNVITKTISGLEYTVLSTDSLILGDTNLNNINVALRAANTNSDSRIRIKNIGINTINIIPSGSETIDFESGVFPIYQYEYLDLIANSSNWNII